MNEAEIKVNAIRKYFKKSNLILEIFLLDYETFNIYIRIDYIKKLNIYKLRWFNLEVLDLNKIEKYMGSEYINSNTLDYILSILDGKNNNYHEASEKNAVIFNCYFGDGYHYQFSRFIPKQLSFLSDIFSIIFSNLPRKLEDFLYELHAEIMVTKSRYEYQDEFIFDLYKDELSSIFNNQVVERGKRYYRENKVEFLEKIDDKYYSVVSGTEKYLCVIKYDENINKMQVYCTCPCEFYCKHTYAVIRAIRDNKFKKFYKILYINNNDNLVGNAINSKYILCSGLEDEYLEIINKYGEIELVPIFDSKDKFNFKILEDDEKGTLAKEIKKVSNK